jgi:hypothetical protein
MVSPSALWLQAIATPNPMLVSTYPHVFEHLGVFRVLCCVCSLHVNFVIFVYFSGFANPTKVKFGVPPHLRSLVEACFRNSCVYLTGGCLPTAGESPKPDTIC